MARVMIRKVGEMPEIAKETFDELKKCHDSIYCTNSSEHNVFKESYKELKKTIKHVRNKTHSSWFTKKLTNSCGAWHIDGYYGMVICSWPNPTEIFVPESNQKIEGDFLDCFNSLKKRNQLIMKFVKKGYGSILIPKPGDIYRLSGPVIHRSNRKSFGHPHVCLRIWYGKQD